MRCTMIRSLAAVAVAAALALVPAAQASTPSSGKLDRGNRSIRWTGGPFVAQNWADACPSQDTTGTLCDRFSLDVRAPAGWTVDVEVHPTDSYADLNVRVLDATGGVVAEDIETEISATVTFKHRRGAAPYSVEVMPYSTVCISGCPVTGTSYEGVARLSR